MSNVLNEVELKELVGKVVAEVVTGDDWLTVVKFTDGSRLEVQGGAGYDGEIDTEFTRE